MICKVLEKFRIEIFKNVRPRWEEGVSRWLCGGGGAAEAAGKLEPQYQTSNNHPWKSVCAKQYLHRYHISANTRNRKQIICANVCICF